MQHFGCSFYTRVCSILEAYTVAWELENIALIDYFSVNCLFTCYSRQYGTAVLKVCQAASGSAEIRALLEYGGSSFCTLFASNMEDGVLLEEAILPGTQLRAVASMEKRVDIFLSLHTKLHIQPKEPEMFTTYSQWVEDAASFIATQDEHRTLCHYMEEARAMYRALRRTYNRDLLLHGDFHHDNILLDKGGAYKIIDPKGVVGDPIFDLPRFILNENDYHEAYTVDENRRHVASAIALIGSRTGLPLHDIRQAFFVEMALANCWGVNGGGTPDLESVAMAYGMVMDS